MNSLARVHRTIAALGALALAACGGGSSGGASNPAPMMPAPLDAPRAVTALAAPATIPAVVTPLQHYQIAADKVFVAGISSGGFFGVQLHVAHSRTYHGAAIYAGGVYHCAQDSVELALAECGGETVNGQALYQSTLAQSNTYLQQQATAGTIDDPASLRGQPVYLWSGTNDSVVNPKEMADLNAQYGGLGTRIRFDDAYPADHGWESPLGEVACGKAASPYMITCDAAGRPYDSEQTWLSMFFGTLHARNATLRGSFARFDQTEFGASAANSMDTNGTVFVPKPCAAGETCGLVVAFHGCLQGHAFIGDKWVTEAGIDEWADSNRIVVLYPYAVAAPGPTPYNPNGCWDWWGYDDSNYALRSGTQISIVQKMVQRVTGRP